MNASKLEDVFRSLGWMPRPILADGSPMFVLEHRAVTDILFWLIATVVSAGFLIGAPSLLLFHLVLVPGGVSFSVYGSTFLSNELSSRARRGNGFS